MRRLTRGWLMAAVSVMVVAACSSLTPGAPSASLSLPSPSGGGSGIGYGGRPIDTTLTPVSASSPGPDAARVLDFCQVSQNDRGNVAGIAKLPHATDVYRYVDLSGKEPGLQGTDPTWVVQFKGVITQPMSGEAWVDPVCVVNSEDSGFYASGPVLDINTHAVKATPMPPSKPATMALPTLAP